MSRAESYLTLPERYAEAAGGLKWAHRGDAIELASGDAVALFDELKEVLAGAFAAPCPPHFGHLLSAYRRLKIGGDGFDAASAAFHAQRLVPGGLRNAGRLIARLCGALPAPPDAPMWGEVELALARVARDGARRRPQLAVEPSLRPSIFESYLKQVLEPFDAETLRHWLTFGTGDKPAGEPIAEPVESLPARVAKALARGRGRLAGAARLVPLLNAALTLPPRKRSANKVPQGGYADITTRGDPSQLLMSQLALDPDEFVRRFAERELLYFEREEPHAPEPATRVMLLDQGVRTWGVVRLALAAAAAALLGKDAKKFGAAEFATTSAGKVDLNTLSTDEIGEHLAASDLSETPVRVVSNAVKAGVSGPRDFVLLTHPRALTDPAVIAAIAERTAGDRLFALSVRDDGRCELTEWREAGPVSLREFRVDLTPPAEAKPEPKAVARSVRDWSGDREPIGFPFRPGLVGEIVLCGVDAAGATLVAVSREGVPQLVTANEAVEVVPRAFRAGKVLREVEAVLGVRGGVVICGRMAAANPAVSTVNTVAVASSASLPADTQPRHCVAVHYDFGSRSVLIHDLGPIEHDSLWEAHPDLHCVNLRDAEAPVIQAGRAVDLDTGEQSSQPSQAGASRVSAACRLYGGTPREVVWTRDPKTEYPRALYTNQTQLELSGTDEGWEPFTPTAEGKPLFGIGPYFPIRTVLANKTLAILRNAKPPQLHLYRGPNGVALRTLTLGNRGQFALSADGERLGVVIDGEARLMDADDSGMTVATAHRAKLHGGLKVSLGRVSILISVGSYIHEFRATDGQLVHGLERRAWQSKAEAQPAGYDSRRFHRFVHGVSPHAAWADQLGQVVLTDADDKPVLAFIVRRATAAVWGAPDIFWGDPTLIGGPPTPAAAARLAVLLAGDQS